MASRVLSAVGASWKVERAPTGAAKRRGTGGADPFLARLMSLRELTLVDAAEARSMPSRRSAAADDLVEISASVASGTPCVLIARHPSGAISFHLPTPRTSTRRGARPSRAATTRFAVTTRSAPPTAARRGVAQRVLKLFLVKAAGKSAEKAIPTLVRSWEERAFERRDLSLGLVRVTAEGLASGHFTPVGSTERLAAPPARHLLLLHGAFSTAEGTFDSLVTTRGSDGRSLFETVAASHGDRILAFNHLALGRSPAENARELLEKLPPTGLSVDIVAHGNGNLLARTLVEQRAGFGTVASRLQVGRVLLVASPNHGTPLASDRLETLLGWLANLLELVPDTPFTTTLEFVSASLAWLAQHVRVDVPGLGAMDPDGDVIAALEHSAPSPPAQYCALVSNYEPDGALWRRIIDVGMDGLFDAPNDLLVPTDDGWRLGAKDDQAIPRARVFAFGPGGNLRSGDPDAANHFNYFAQPETVDVLAQALGLAPESQSTSALRSTRGGTSEAAAARPASRKRRAPASARTDDEVEAGLARSVVERKDEPPRPPDRLLDEVFNLFVLSPQPEVDVELTSTSGRRRRAELAFVQAETEKRKEEAHLVAMFRNARVTEPFRLRGGAAGARWDRVIEMQQSLRDFVDGTATQPPGPAELRAHGGDLFRLLLPGEVRRLYDHARADVGNRRLEVSFTSMVSWVADVPWEFAFDPARLTYLCTEDVNFVRNVYTAVPAEPIAPRAGPLNILVVAAQPVSAVELSANEEIDVIQRGFMPLVKEGLVNVEVIRAATPNALHRRLEHAVDNRDRIDVLHFIGHGEYDHAKGRGYLLFEDGSGGAEPLAAEHVRQIACRRGIRLIFLNACETGTGHGGGGSARALDFNSGVAPELVRGGVPAVVANQFKVLDASATGFARHFYWSLAQGRTLGDAAREARVAVSYSLGSDAIDWAVPVVYARDPGARIATGGAAWDAAPDPGVREGGNRRRSRTQGIPIGVWDVNNIAPNLQRVLSRLNAVQSMWHFERLNLSAPIGTWQVPRAGRAESVGVLRIDRVLEAMKGTPTKLGVAHVLCLTSFPIGDGEYSDLDVYWDEGDLAAMSIAMYADHFDPPRLSLDRAIANFVATVLSEMPVHGKKQGPATCPLFFNNDNDIEAVAGRLAFCKKHRVEDRARADALDRILGAFP